MSNLLFVKIKKFKITKTYVPYSMKTGAVSKLFDIPKIAIQIYSWEFEPQRKDILQDCGVPFPRGAMCVFSMAAIFLTTLPMVFLQSVKTSAFSPTNRDLLGKLGI